MEPILQRSNHPRALILTAISVALLLTAAGFVLDVTQPDLALAITLNSLHAGWFGTITTAVYRIFEPGPAIAITVATTGLIWLARRDIRPASAFAGTVALTWVPSDIVKLLVGRPRPPMADLPHPYSPFQLDPSYPSGHAVFVTAFLIALTMLLGTTRWGTLMRWLTPVIIIGVGIALTVDAVHYLTDVLASICWSAAVAPTARMVWVQLFMPRIRWLAP